MKGHIRPGKAEGTWYLVVYLGKDASGKERRKWKTVHGGKRFAQQELNKLLAQLQTGQVPDVGSLTVAQFLDRWLLEYGKRNLGAQTYEEYESIIRQHLVPHLGRHRLEKLQPLHLERYYNEALASGHRHGGGLSPTTVAMHHRILKRALRQAIRWRLLTHNPADGVDPPRKAEFNPVVPDLVLSQRIRDAVRGSPLEVPVEVTLGTGMRRGELLALRWSDLRLDARPPLVVISRSLQATKNGLLFKEPKTEAGKRTITLPDFAVEALRRHWERQLEEKRLVGPGYQDHGLVFAHPDGTPFHPDRFSRWYERFAAQLGVPDMRFHDLRHGHATLLLAEGVEMKIISERLGHSGIAITADLYSHVTIGMQKVASDKLNAAMGGEPPPPPRQAAEG